MPAVFWRRLGERHVGAARERTRPATQTRRPLEMWNLELGIWNVDRDDAFQIPNSRFLIPNSCGVAVFEVPTHGAPESIFNAARHESELALCFRGIDEHLVPRHADALERDRRLAA